jgi:transposase
MRYELTDHEWAAIKPMLPNKLRRVARVNDRRILNGIFWVLGSGAPWRDLPQTLGPYTTCYNRFVRWRRAGVWGRMMNALAGAHDAAVQMIDTSIVRVHQYGACITRNRRQSMGRSRGGLTSKIHAVVDTNGLPVRSALTADEAHDNRLAGSLLSGLDRCCLQTEGMTPIGSEHSSPSGALGPTYRREAIVTSRSALARISTVRATWSSGSSIRSSHIGGSRRAMASSRPTTSLSFSSHQYGCGCALSPRPNYERAHSFRNNSVSSKNPVDAGSPSKKK